MWKFIEKLRTLPEGSRKAVVLFSSAGITGIILLSWLVFPVPHFGSLSTAEKERKNAADLAAPFSVFGDEIHQAVGGLKNEWSSFGGTAGVVSALSEIQKNVAKENATSSVSSATPTDEIIATTTATTPSDNATNTIESL